MISVYQVNKLNNGSLINVVIWSNQLIVKRIHSSRMRTTRLLTVSRSALGGGVVNRGGGVCLGNLPRECLPRVVSTHGEGEGVSAHGAGEVYALGVYSSMHWGRHLPAPPPRTEFLTHACTLVKTCVVMFIHFNGSATDVLRLINTFFIHALCVLTPC